jgi:VWFA-related protein
MLARRRVSVSNTFQILLCVLCCLSAGSAQTTQPPRPQTQDEVVHVYTELVQTDVMVFDRQGRFVNGLNRENFELRIDGKVRPIQSFELITAGSDEEAQLAAARGSTMVNPKHPVPLDRGRTVFFYVDDFHLDLAGLIAAKNVISSFIDKQMGQNDQAAIVSATGQVGFLQQLTTDRSVLRAALDRLKPRSFSVTDNDRPSMGPYEALLIDREDMDVFEFYVSETIRLNPGLNRETAGGIVHSRAQALAEQAGAFTMNTLRGLEGLVRGVNVIPGRKVLFLLSGGFFLDNRRSDSMARLRDVTAAAAKSGVVIYSMDARGLVTDTPDAGSDRPFDPSGRLAMSTRGELLASQDGLNALAQDTGGKALFNTNDLKQGLAPSITETSKYYLLAWKPEPNNQKAGRFRNIQVSVVGKSDLTVRVRKGFFDVDPTPEIPKKAAGKSDEVKTVAAQLHDSITAPYPQSALPVLLGLNYYDIPGKGATVPTAVQIPGEFLTFASQDEKVQAFVDIVGVYFDEKGRPRGSFTQRLVTTAPSAEAVKTYRDDVTFTYSASLAPGLYQVRVAVRDEKSGRLGSAHEWIEIPDLTTNQLSMSSLLLGEALPAVLTNVSSPGGNGPVILSANHRFHRQSSMRFLVFAYNAALSTTDHNPDVAVQVQVIRDDQPVITTALRKVNTADAPDPARLSYAADVPLSALLPGRYILQVTIIDRVSNRSTSRQAHFDVY